MVNILEYWPEHEAPEEMPWLYDNTVQTWAELLAWRDELFTGFHLKEQSKGLAPINRSLSIPGGQDFARTLCFRVLEELAESVDSRTVAHKMEELIDAFNYLTALMTYDPTLFTITELAEITREIFDWESPYGGYWITKNPYQSIGDCTVQMGKFADTLRNRSWMENAQSVQFLGKKVIKKMYQDITRVIISEFPDFKTFSKYFYAKNKVLEFRLESRY